MTNIEPQDANVEESELVGENPKSSRPESGRETEADLIAGAEMLETPPEGSFVHGLQVFVAWVNSLLADDPKK